MSTQMAENSTFREETELAVAAVLVDKSNAAKKRAKAPRDTRGAAGSSALLLVSSIFPSAGSIDNPVPRKTLERFRNQILTRPSNEERAPLAPRCNCSPGRAHGEAPSVVRDGQAVNAIVLEICPAVSEVTRVGPLQLAFGSEVTARAGALIDIDTGTVRCES